MRKNFHRIWSLTMAVLLVLSTLPTAAWAASKASNEVTVGIDQSSGRPPVATLPSGVQAPLQGGSANKKTSAQSILRDADGNCWITLALMGIGEKHGKAGNWIESAAVNNAQAAVYRAADDSTDIDSATVYLKAAAGVIPEGDGGFTLSVTRSMPGNGFNISNETMTFALDAAVDVTLDVTYEGLAEGDETPTSLNIALLDGEEPITAAADYALTDKKATVATQTPLYRAGFAKRNFALQVAPVEDFAVKSLNKTGDAAFALTLAKTATENVTLNVLVIDETTDSENGQTAVFTYRFTNTNDPADVVVQTLGAGAHSVPLKRGATYAVAQDENPAFETLADDETIENGNTVVAEANASVSFRNTREGGPIAGHVEWEGYDKLSELLWPNSGYLKKGYVKLFKENADGSETPLDAAFSAAEIQEAEKKAYDFETVDAFPQYEPNGGDPIGYRLYEMNGDTKLSSGDTVTVNKFDYLVSYIDGGGILNTRVGACFVDVTVDSPGLLFNAANIFTNNLRLYYGDQLLANGTHYQALDTGKSRSVESYTYRFKVQTNSEAMLTLLNGAPFDPAQLKAREIGVRWGVLGQVIEDGGTTYLRPASDNNVGDIFPVTVTYSGTVPDGLTVTRDMRHYALNVSAKGARSAVTLQLYRLGKKEEAVGDPFVLNADNGWQTSFSDLPLGNIALNNTFAGDKNTAILGGAYAYSVREVADGQEVAEGGAVDGATVSYSAPALADGALTVTHAVKGYAALTVNKTFTDDSVQMSGVSRTPPAVTFTLTSSDASFQPRTQTLSALEGNEAGTQFAGTVVFDALPAFDAEGNAVTYAVSETLDVSDNQPYTTSPAQTNLSLAGEDGEAQAQVINSASRRRTFADADKTMVAPRARWCDETGAVVAVPANEKTVTLRLTLGAGSSANFQPRWSVDYTLDGSVQDNAKQWNVGSDSQIHNLQRNFPVAWPDGGTMVFGMSVEPVPEGYVARWADPRGGLDELPLKPFAVSADALLGSGAKQGKLCYLIARDAQPKAIVAAAFEGEAEPQAIAYKITKDGETVQEFSMTSGETACKLPAGTYAVEATAEAAYDATVQVGDGEPVPGMSASFTLPDTGAVRIEFLYKKAALTLTYDPNGLEAGAPVVLTDQPDEVTLRSLKGLNWPDNEDQLFLGWAMEQDAVAAPYAPGDTLELTEPVTLYAVWQSPDVQVTIDMTVLEGEPLELGKTVRLTGTPEGLDETKWIYHYQWQSSADGAAWTDVQGANAKTYEFGFTEALNGMKWRLVVKGKKK